MECALNDLKGASSLNMSTRNENENERNQPSAVPP